MPFEKAKWIWSNQHAETDEYAEFVDSFYYEGGRAKLYISADSNYAVYLNGKLSAWGQYADFPYDKVYDEIDITEYCKKGSNRMAILVWYYGIDTTQCYYPGNASLIYEVSCAENVLCLSDEKTLSRKSHAYISHKNKLITGQLGLSYEYDATKEDSWIIEDVDDFSESVIVKQAPSMRVRPCQRLIMEAEVCGKKCKEIERNDLIFDLGGEQVGFLSFEIESDCEQEIVVAYGEHLALGCVHQKVEGRDFSISYRATKGKNVFLNPFRRFGCRYLEIHSKTPLKIHKMAIAPTMYPVKQKDKPVLNNKHNKIYDMCVETLKLGNYLSILCGAIEGTEAKALCERIREDENITPISLSMKCFKYDAWLKVDANAYAPAIFEDIERVYTPMIESGGTTVWETELGEADFGGAGSLCHGWSALPVYYYHILNQAKNE